MVRVPKPCITCGVPTTLGGRCGEHAHLNRDAETVKKKNKAQAAYRTTDWQRARLLAIARDHMACLVCSALTDLTVHHVNHRTDGTHLTARDNLATLCRSCHSRVEGEHNRSARGEYTKKLEQALALRARTS